MARFPSLATGGDFNGELKGLIGDFIRATPDCRVLEAGGIDRPLLERSPGFTYHGLDIEYRPRCREVYDAFWVRSIEEPLPAAFDIVCSFTLLEHVGDNRKAIRAMFDGLSPGGMIAHFVPNGLHPYSIIIRLLGPKRSVALLKRFHPETIGKSGYPAYFDHCTVPAMRKLCREAGFEEPAFSCYYRANFYFEVFFPAFLLVTLWENLCRAAGLERFCSGFVMRARKPGGGALPGSSR